MLVIKLNIALNMQVFNFLGSWQITNSAFPIGISIFKNQVFVGIF